MFFTRTEKQRFCGQRNPAVQHVCECRRNVVVSNNVMQSAGVLPASRGCQTRNDGRPVRKLSIGQQFFPNNRCRDCAFQRGPKCVGKCICRRRRIVSLDFIRDRWVNKPCLRIAHHSGRVRSSTVSRSSRYAVIGLKLMQTNLKNSSICRFRPSVRLPGGVHNYHLSTS